MMKLKIRAKLLLGRRLGHDRESGEKRFYRRWKEVYYQNLFFLQQDKMEREIFHCCIMLKNLSVVQMELPLSADYMLEQLMESSKPLRSTYADILTAYRKGEGKQAFSILSKRIPTKAAKDFARILGKLDKLMPADLIFQMDSFLSGFAEERKTKAMAKAERKSLITTLTSTTTVFVVLLNFIVVVIFLDTLTVLQNIF